MDAGSYKDPSFHEAKIPTLREVFIWLSTTNLQLNIELKTDVIHYPNIEEKAVALVREYHLSNQIVFSSFNHDSVSLLAKLLLKSQEQFYMIHHLLIQFPKQNIEKQVDYIQTSSY